MKKILFLLLAILMMSTLILVGCGTKTTSTTTSTTVAPTTTAAKPATTAPATTAAAPATTAAPTAAAGAHPVQGSIVRIMNQGPTVLFPPEEGPNDFYTTTYCLEPLLVQQGVTGVFEGVIAESWKIDQTAKTITFNIRKGVKFHDGTTCDAKAVAWNLQLAKDAKVLYYTYIASMDVLDDYTVRCNMSQLDITTLTQMSSMGMISPTAYQNAGTTEDARKAWARVNPVGTGPYKFVEFKRDAYVKFTRFDNYWRTGKPYIKNVTIQIIPDLMVASALLQSGDADCWWSNANITTTAIDLEKKKFGVNWWTGGISYFILFNSADPNKPWHDVRVRTALEYAMNRPELAALVGTGKYIPLTQVAAPGALADNGGDPHPFSIQKAKDLLTQAGYPNGFKTTLLTQPRDTVTAAAIQGYLKAAGIDCALDVADTARYYNQIWTTTGWSDITLVLMPLATNSAEIIFQMGSRPLNFKAACFYKTQTLLDLSEKALTYPTYESAQTIMKQMVKEYSDQTLCVALFIIPYSLIYNNIPGIAYHTNFLTPVDGSLWRVYDDWTDKTK
jgi:peptide/nickel transport system substrate-binding protein